MINKVFIVGGIVLFLYLRKKNKENEQGTDTEFQELGLAESIDIIQERMHDFLKMKFPDAPDEEIAKDVILITSNLTTELEIG